MDTREYSRKLKLSKIPELVAPSDGKIIRKFKSGLYFNDKEDDPSEASKLLYLVEPKKSLTPLINTISNLYSEHFLKPKAICGVKDTQHFRLCFDDDVTYSLSDFVKKYGDSLFETKIENGIESFAMAPILQIFILRIILAVLELHSEGKVHGNLSMKTTYVHSKGDLHIPKLLEVKGEVAGKSLEEAKSLDLKNVEAIIEEIFESQKKPPTSLTVHFRKKLSQNDATGALDHSVFFTFGSKEYCVRQLFARNMILEYANHKLKWPDIRLSVEDEPKYDKTKFQDFIRYLKDKMQHKKEASKLILDEVEQKWPMVWADLHRLSIYTQRQ